jgi:hypothetical protein
LEADSGANNIRRSHVPARVIKIENMIDSRILRKLDESGFIDRPMRATARA